MTQRRSLDRHRRSLEEMRAIMSSMKSLAYIETQKLTRRLDAQRDVVASIERAAADFLAFHPALLPPADTGTPVSLVIGSERGFCGELNRALLERVQAKRAGEPAALRMLWVGRKLHMLLADEPQSAARIDGAGAVEEVGVALNRIVVELAELQRRHGALRVSVLYSGIDHRVVERHLLPSFRELAAPIQSEAHPPLMNLAPADLLLELSDHYVFAALREILYAALMAENVRRVAHLDGAVRHLEDRANELARRAATLRQEEIIEEIEVILLNAAGGGPRSP